MSNAVKNFKKLRIWEKGINIVEMIYKLTKNFPKEEVYVLSSQMRRAAVSIPSNIAEGFKRYNPKEYKYFLHIALGSAVELETQLIISMRLDYITKKEFTPVVDELSQFSRMTTALIKKLNIP